MALESHFCSGRLTQTKLKYDEHKPPLSWKGVIHTNTLLVEITCWISLPPVNYLCSIAEW